MNCGDRGVPLARGYNRDRLIPGENKAGIPRTSDRPLLPALRPVARPGQWAPGPRFETVSLFAVWRLMRTRTAFRYFGPRSVNLRAPVPEAAMRSPSAQPTG
jgi:hypothetical protein